MLLLLDGAGQVLVLPVVSVLDLHHVGGQLPGGAHVDGVGADLDGLLGLLVQQVQLDWIAAKIRQYQWKLTVNTELKLNLLFVNFDIIIEELP